VETSGKHVAAFDRRGAAEYLSISTRLLDDLLSAGVVQKVKIGRKTLVRKIDLDSYLERLAKESRPTEPRANVQTY
jgi:excisionase family DNA binding protein